jgi:hypothetical protein
MDQEVQHIVTLPANLKASLNPIQLGRLEELGRLELTEKILLRHSLLWSCVELVKHKAFEELLVRDSNFDRLARWAMLKIPVFYKGNILCSPHPA